jgi:UDP-N-acetylmuramate--alanine ligase
MVNRGMVIAIAGTHGKTTTTAMTAAILAEAGLDPTGFVGGHVPGWVGGLRPGSDEIFVVEADEYDRSFLTLRPRIAVVTAIDADHLDIYGSIAGIRSAFNEFLLPVPADGLIAACVDDPGARQLLLEEAGPRGLGYGLSSEATLRALGVEARGRGTSFEVQEEGRTIAELEIGVPGLHNVRNALAALAAARHAGADLDAVARGLASFHGVARRFEEIGEAAGILVVDDYAHHPTEIAVTIAAARAAYPERRVVIAFQPHLYTRTRDFSVEFGRALAAADQLWITEIYPARELPIPGVTGALVVAEAEGAGAREVHYRPELGALADELAATLRSGDLLVTMGAGNITEVGPAILARLRGEG